MKTHEELQLSKEEFDALLKVREMLATTPTHREEVVHDDDYARERAKKMAEESEISRELWYYLPSEQEISLLDGFGGFNMTQMCCAYDPSSDDKHRDYYDCGTVGCIAGWMGIFMWGKPPVIGEKCVTTVELADKISDFVADFDNYPRKYANPDDFSSQAKSGAYKLFFPADTYGDRISTAWDKITPAHAVQAIDNFLEHGDPLWNDVLPFGNNAAAEKESV